MEDRLMQFIGNRELRPARTLVQRSIPNSALDFDGASPREREAYTRTLLRAAHVSARGESPADEKVDHDVEGSMLVNASLSSLFVGPIPDTSDKCMVRYVVCSGMTVRDEKDLELGGVDWTGYELNPVFLFSHQWELPPIGVCRAIRQYKRNGVDELWKDIEYTPADLYPFGYRMGQMAQRGFMRACSGGWLVNRVRVARNSDGSVNHVTYVNVDWVETSQCSVPVDKFSVAQQVMRGLLSPEDGDYLDKMARPNRMVADVRSLSNREVGNPRNGQRVLVSERILDNPFEDEWMQIHGNLDKQKMAGGAPMSTAATRAKSGWEGWPGATNWDKCIAKMTASKDEGGSGYDQATAEKVCGAIKAGRSLTPAEADKLAETVTRALGDGGDPDLPDPEVEEKPTPEAEAPQGEAESAQDSSGAEGATPGEGEDEKPAEGQEDAATRGLNRNRATVTRGAVTGTLDAARDQLVAGVMALAAVADQVDCAANTAFYAGRSAAKPDRKRAETVLRSQFERALPEAVKRMMDMGAEMAAMPSPGDYLVRALDRGDSAVKQVSGALKSMRSAVDGLNVSVVTQALKVARAGRTLSQANYDLIQQAIKVLQQLSSADPRQADNEEAEDKSGMSDSELMEMDPEMSATMRSLTEGATRALDAREAEPALKKLAAFRSVADGALSSMTQAKEQKPEAKPEASKVEEKPVKQQAVRSLPGIKLPDAVALRIGLGK